MNRLINNSDKQPSPNGLQGRIDRQDVFDRIDDSSRGLATPIMGSFFDDEPEPGAASTETAGEHHRMEFGLFDDDFVDNVESGLDRNLGSMGMFDDGAASIQENERYLF